MFLRIDSIDGTTRIINTDNLIQIEEKSGKVYVVMDDCRVFVTTHTLAQIEEMISGQYSQTYENSVVEMNKRYDLPVPSHPVLYDDTVARLKHFKDIILEEISEVDDIIADIEALGPEPTREQVVTVLGDIADWLADIQVYCTSEIRKYGIPNELSLRLVMKSGLTKLDENGNPIKDERGKFLKGPNYVPPEPDLREMIQSRMNSM
jgi:hypothetical protein